MPTENNEITLNSYELGINEYVSKTAPEPSDDVKRWIDRALTHLTKDASILEIGSGFGKDARYIESRGFLVQRTDATEGFVNLLKEEAYSAHLFNVLTQDFISSYDLIFANAVFLHFTPSELEKTLKKVCASLSPQGLLAFSVKKGDGEEWTSVKLGHPRYFCYWRSENLAPLLESTGFDILEITENQPFLHIIAKKQ